jgi:hypothetical protein
VRRLGRSALSRRPLSTRTDAASAGDGSYPGAGFRDDRDPDAAVESNLEIGVERFDGRDVGTIPTPRRIRLTHALFHLATRIGTFRARNGFGPHITTHADDGPSRLMNLERIPISKPGNEVAKRTHDDYSPGRERDRPRYARLA